MNIFIYFIALYLINMSAAADVQNIMACAFLLGLKDTNLGTLIMLRNTLAREICERTETCPTMILNSWMTKNHTKRSVDYVLTPKGRGVKRKFRGVERTVRGWECTLTIRDEDDLEIKYFTCVTTKEIHSILNNSESKKKHKFKKLAKKRAARLAVAGNPEKFCI